MAISIKTVCGSALLPSVRLALIALVTLPTAVGVGGFGQAQARCMIQTIEQGFVQDKQMLPANAKGVLFDANFGLGVYNHRNKDLRDIVVLAHPMREALSPKHFHIVEVDSGRTLEASIDRTPIRMQLPLPQGKYYAARSSKLRDCAAQNLYSLDGCPELEQSTRRLIDEGQLYDAEQQVQAAYGLFVVAPKDGFNPGRSYVLRYTGPLKDKENNLHYKREMRLTVDTKSVPSLVDGQATLTLNDKGALDIQLPKTHLAYRDYMYFYTFVERKDERRLLADEQLKWDAMRFTDVCWTPNYLGMNHPDGFGRNPFPCDQLTSYIGFFEMDPELHVATKLKCPAQGD